ncbi:hypothetical protein MRX96_033081 [Rhipicephalus microplus]
MRVFLTWLVPALCCGHQDELQGVLIGLHDKGLFGLIPGILDDIHDHGLVNLAAGISAFSEYLGFELSFDLFCTTTAETGAPPIVPRPLPGLQLLLHLNGPR